MTPKEKARELINKFIPHTRVFKEVLGWEDDIDSAKQCALIAVDLRLDGDFIFTSIEYGKDSLEYWQEVKQEINNL